MEAAAGKEQIQQCTSSTAGTAGDGWGAGISKSQSPDSLQSTGQDPEAEHPSGWGQIQLCMCEGTRPQELLLPPLTQTHFALIPVHSQCDQPWAQTLFRAPAGSFQTSISLPVQLRLGKDLNFTATQKSYGQLHQPQPKQLQSLSCAGIPAAPTMHCPSSPQHPPFPAAQTHHPAKAPAPGRHFTQALLRAAGWKFPQVLLDF